VLARLYVIGLAEKDSIPDIHNLFATSG